MNGLLGQVIILSYTHEVTVLAGQILLCWAAV